MMLKPYMNELLKKIPNRYELVNVTAKRARDIAEECQEQGIEMEEKPVTLALEEIDEGKIVPKYCTAEPECECCCEENTQCEEEKGKHNEDKIGENAEESKADTEEK